MIERSEKSTDVGLFSAFTSYVSSVMNDDPPEPNGQEIEATLCAVDCISACRFEEILGNVSELPVESLKSLTLSLLSQLPEQKSPRVITVKPEIAAPTPLRPNGVRPEPDQPVYDPAVVYILELTTILALRDEETITTLGADVAEALQLVIADAERLHPVALSRTVFYLLSLLRASNDHKYIRTPVVLHAISSFRDDLLIKCALPILKGIYGCISGPAELKNEMATSPDFWSVLHDLQSLPEASQLVFQIVESVASGQTSAITADNYEAAVALLNAFATAGAIGAGQEQQRDPAGRRSTEEKKPPKDEAVLRGTRALALVSQLTARVPSLIEQSHLETNEAWRTYWSPVFRCLATQCVNTCREIRNQAFSSLQRCLLSPELASPDHKEWTNIFSEVLFPLINQLLKPEVYQTDPAGMGTTRAQAAQLLCRIFLHYLVLLGEWDGVLDLWIKILAIMDRLMNSGQSDTLIEAIPESLKNILLVMGSGDHLNPPPSEGKDERTELQVRMWNETWTRLDRFLPDLMPEIFPDQVGKAPVESAAETQSSASSESESEETKEETKTSALPERLVAEPQAA